MAPSQAYFQNAHDFNVHNGQFITNIINNSTNIDPVSTILWPHVAAGAIFDSAERYTAGKCHPGTRKKIIDCITHWIADNNTTRRVLWLHGPAGGGKSAIEHTMCEILKQQHPESYGASFFFKSGDKDRGNARKLFTTLAYQLAIHFPSIRSQINDALSHDPSLPTKSMEIQFLSLIVQPLLHCQSLLSHSPIVVIDGLDECADDEGTDTQREIIALIGKFIVQYTLPIRVMVASRPEFWIRDVFDTAPLPTITQILSLRDDEDADKDIKAYLIDGFEKIRVENKRVMASVVPPWPPEEIIRHFVYQASGQYVYASIVLKFVGRSFRFIDPQKQLEIIISPGPHRALAFSELDRLYITILTAYSELETMKRVLGGLLFHANTSVLKTVLNINPNELSLVLDALSALIDIQNPGQLPEDHLFLESIFGPFIDGQDKITFCHRSFCEFLQDENRSGAFHIDKDVIGREILEQFFNMFDRNVDQNYEIEPHHFVNLDRFTYHNTMLDLTRRFIFGRSNDAQVVAFFSRMTKRLASCNPRCKSPDSLLSFMRDLERIQMVFMESPRPVGWQTAYEELENAVLLVQRSAMHALSLFSTFKVSPTIVYLTECRTSLHPGISINELSTIPGTVDVMSTIRQHRHFLHLCTDHSIYSIYERDITVLSIMNVLPFQDAYPKNGSRIHDEWNIARIFLAYHQLKIILDIPVGPYQKSAPFDFLETYFFNSRETSDITTEEYFQNANNLSILALMTDLEIWNRFRQNHGGWYRQTWIVSMLCWFNRQLTNQQSLKLLQGYDKSLQQKMTATMTVIFKFALLPDLTGFYEQGLFVYATVSGHWDGTLLLLKVLPLPQGCHQDEERHPYADKKWNYLSWGSFLDEVCGRTGPMKSAINPLSWCPFVISQLLVDLARFLYGQIPGNTPLIGQYEESLPYLNRCLPYAKPTLKDLEAIRAIVYLYPQSAHRWNPPENFWHLIGEFLQKYDPSVLSSEELALFMLWLESPDHADITTYIMTKQECRPALTETGTVIDTDTDTDNGTGMYTNNDSDPERANP